ncbi:uncharacterized protein LOC128556853 isoform X2 [Mercenaria mercenaria]|uniref:uncharacterized protein LOC128556853 isoform X2 n=1 Tax=Mercenaria mercenaria TaxID=6596 RepID=UPI00234F3C6E|nr:uncharacterized protein LOC128556853 isoform X2 [Mercenaria mercenaria]
MCAFHCISTDIFKSTSGNMPKRLDPRDIRFTHDSVDETFDDGRHLEDTLRELKDGTTDVETIPRITVVKKDGMIFSPNNRRLWVFKEYAKFLENKNKVLEVPVKFGTSDGLKSCDMTTTNEGENVEVRPNGSEKYDRNIETVRLYDVLYSTDKLYRFSKSGGHYQRSTIDDELKRFSSNVNETKLLPVLKVVKRKGHLYALDNLELWLLKQWHEKNPEGLAIKDKNLPKVASTGNVRNNGSGNESQNERPGVTKDTVNKSDTNHQDESPRSRKREKSLESVIYQREVSDACQSVEGKANKLDSDIELQKQIGDMELDLKEQHEEKNDEDLTKSHLVPTDHLKHNDVLNGGENVRIELRPYRELTEIFTTIDEGRSIQIVWDEPKKDKGKKFKPLTRQKPSQERKDLVKYCQSYENQSKRSSRR